MSAILLHAAVACIGISHALRHGAALGRAAAPQLRAVNDEEPESQADWDRAWQRWQMENGDRENDAAPLDSSTVGDAMAELLSAEAAIRSAQEEVSAARQEKARLEAELAALQQQRRLPYAFEEIDELYRLIEKMDGQATWVLVGRAALVACTASLLLRWRNEGFASVVGCVLLPLACATGQV